MTIDDIDARIAPQLPNVRLSSGTFQQDAALTGLLQQYFSGTGGQIAIDGVEQADYALDRTAGTIRFSGVGEGGPFDRVPLKTVEIRVLDGLPQLSIDGYPAGGWTLVQSFPGITSPVARQLSFQQVRLAWASVEDDDYDEGFYLEAVVDLNGPPLSLLAFLFPGLDVLPVWGSIAMEGSATPAVVQYVPDMALESDDVDASVTLGPLTLHNPSFSMYASPVFNSYTRIWQTDTRIELIAFGLFKDTWFQITVDLADVGGTILFKADLDAPLAATLAELVAFVGGTALEIPGFTLQAPDDLFLKEIRVAYDPAGTPKLKLLAVDIATSAAERWHLWGDVYLEHIEITFHLIPGATGYVVDGEIRGQIGNAQVGYWLALQAGFASDGHYSFGGELLAPITIGQVYKFFTGDELADAPDLDIDSLDFSFDRPAMGGATYAAEISIATTWPILTSPITIVLDSLTFTIAHDAEDTSVTAGGVLSLSDYSVGLDASFDSIQGWMFDGTVSAEPGAITLADAIGKIDDELHLDTSKGPAVPPLLTEWSVHSLGAAFATQAKDFDFTIAVTNAAVPSLELDFGVHLTHSETELTKTLDAQAHIMTPAFAVDVDVDIEQTTSAGPPPSKAFTLTGTYSATTPPKLDDLLAWIAAATKADANLPAELALDAEAQGFAIRIEQKDADPYVMEAAGELSMQAAGSTWSLYVSYTNATSFADGMRAMVNGRPVYVFGAALGGLVDLSKLPLVGRIPGIAKLRIDKVGFFYTNAQFSASAPELRFDVPAMATADVLAPDATAAVLTQPGFTLMAVLGNDVNASGTGVHAAGTLPLPMGTGQPPPGAPPAFAQTPAAPAEPIEWLDLNKTIGPVLLQKIGLGYEKAGSARALGTIAFYVDGAFAIAGVALTLDRLGVAIDVPNPKAGISFNPFDIIEFRLGGLFLDYAAPDLQISGGFITLPDSRQSFIGEFSVIAGEFGLQAYGGFSSEHSDPSLFLFLHVEVPIGGPPFLFVNGLAGGFGVNRAFKLPTFAQLVTYPFLPASPVIPTPSQLTGTPPSQLAIMTRALTTLAQYVPVSPGEYWLAAGLDVSSFHMVEVSAVLSADFGVNFQIGVVGAASLTFPVGEVVPIAYVQIDFEVTFSPSNGQLSAFGSISPASFLYSGLVHLSGGFAFDTWFRGPDAGNYVVTLGGYNLHYQRPAIYPDVPRVQARFGIDGLTAVGDAYCALVPHALMAGLDVHATWSLGSLDAWFDAGLDFLLNWKPFHYEADGRIEIGVSLTIKVLFVHVRITVHAGVDLVIWGPSFGGQAHVDLDVTSFTIRFGGRPAARSVGWTDFRAFLPSVDGRSPGMASPGAAAGGAETANKPLVNVVATAGLLKTFTPGDSREGLDWLIDPNGFTITTQSSAPCTDATVNDLPPLRTLPLADYLDPSDLTASVAAALDRKRTAPFFAYEPPASGPAWNDISVGAAPMGHRRIQSVHGVTLQTVDEQGRVGSSVREIIAVLQTGNVPQALWGNAGVSARSLQAGHELIAGPLTGLSIVPMIWFPKRTTFIPYYDLVFDANDLFMEQDATSVFNTAPFADPGAIDAAMASGALFASTAGVRGGIVALLQQHGFAHLALTQDADLNTGQYAANPLLVYLSGTSETHLS